MPIPTFNLIAQLESTTSPDVIAFFVVLLILLGLVPLGYLGYLLLVKHPEPARKALLLVSTDEEVIRTVNDVAKALDYGTIHIYRHEDALNQWARSMSPLSIMIVDDSVPHAEAGLLLTALHKANITPPPLILIEDNVELEETTRSFRADAILEKPIDPNRLRLTLRTIAARYENLLPQI